MRAVIFANGQLGEAQGVQAELRPDDWIIAADGGAHHCLTLGLRPAVIIGDMDSLDDASLVRLAQDGTELLRHPIDKDATDLELALRHAVERRPDEIVVFGALGDRWDQSIANALLVALPEFDGMPIRLRHDRQVLFLIPPGPPVDLPGRPGDTVSLIPLAGGAAGITTRGLAFPLQGGGLDFASTRGISNRIRRLPASVRLEKGLLLCIVENGGRPAAGEVKGAEDA
jgi:thiamine pyrophosphokinase